MGRAFVAVATMLAVLAFPSPALAATFTVDSTGDGADANTADGVCDDGAGNCTLRAAIQQANASSGADTIEFNIPGPAPYTIMPGSALPTITEPVTIDGTTEPDFAGDPIIELDGSNAGAGPVFSNGLTISAGGSTVRGLTINRFFGVGIFLLGGSGNVIEGNYIGTNLAGTADLGNVFDGILAFGSSTNTIGGTAGTTPGADCNGACNLISGNGRDGVGIVGAATNNQVKGNYIGTTVTGLGDLGNSFDGVFIGGSLSAATGNVIGGTTASARNVISGNDRDGVRINNAGSTGNVVLGNFIGTDAAGSADLGNTEDGVFIDGAALGNTIGGTAAGAGNLISGNNIDGVSLSAAGAGNAVQGNKIGTDAAGTVGIGNTLLGVRIVATSDSVVGGTAAGAANTLAFNGEDGVAVLSGTGNSIRGNSIFSNTALGIDLGINGVTPNDPDDIDAGANNLQNFPEVTAAGSAGGVTIVQGTLNSTPLTVFALDFFSSPACDPSGFGEGKSFLGSATVTTDAGGDASFTVTFATGVAVGDVVTATATDPLGNTSELSKCREVKSASGLITDLIGDVQGLGLNQGVTNSLVVKLQNALNKIGSSQTGAACNNLDAFVNEVNALVQSGKLTSQEGKELTDAASLIKTLLGCP